jgi:hypothetical protein
MSIIPPTHTHAHTHTPYNYFFPIPLLRTIIIRMQTTSSGGYRSAFSHITSPSVAGGSGGVFGFYRGLVPAVEQRIVARGPMFLVSELFTQGVENNTSLSGTSARWTGSEYRKKLLSQSVITAKEARWGTLVKSAMHAGEGTSLIRRLHAAGTCAAVYDSTFFTTQEYLSKGQVR